ncbi:MAG: hypothetical protein PF588_05810 [Candidatus Kapabacteria bacterium]|jgi:Zn finger protein HypA/HybF involved in hydrogenase expression|nr:hypothetical protein [Candidatus Kapabacteria bacterium]
MDIEKKLCCKNCGESLSNLNVNVITEVCITWNSDEGHYLATSGQFALEDVDYFICPKCHIENPIQKD